NELKIKELMSRLVKDVKDCYACLGVIHEHYTPIPGRFKDYIAVPKPNKYQSLHTTVFDKDKDTTPFEIQIRTFEMHEIDEYGVAAHWAYKENGGSKENKDISELNKMNWLHDILDVDKQSNNTDFLNFVKNDLDIFAEKVYCFSPQGDVITLPRGSTPIDFAYHIHSAVGNKMVGAKVNEVLVPIDYEIKNGDRVNIITSQNSQGPSRDWLKVVKSAQAKNKIQRWFKQERREDNISYGKEAFEKYCKQHRIKQEDILKDEYLKVVYKKYTCQNLDDIYAMIGHGGVKESQIVSRLLEELHKESKEIVTDEDVKSLIDNQKKNTDKTSSTGVIISGAEGLDVHFSKCCNPLPGDEIVGFVTRGRGITIHRTDCKNI
ncbi:MAG: TGS domain-containing protein, partial [Lachnospiraceae bacterium]|nr:TGS domain-containing protein [Lachnospiraceae bacterium]